MDEGRRYGDKNNIPAAIIIVIGATRPHATAAWTGVRPRSPTRATADERRRRLWRRRHSSASRPTRSSSRLRFAGPPTARTLSRFRAPVSRSFATGPPATRRRRRRRRRVPCAPSVRPSFTALRFSTGRSCVRGSRRSCVLRARVLAYKSCRYYSHTAV